MNWKLKLIRKLLYIPLAIENRLFLDQYKKKIPILVERIRKKENIKVLFVISQLPKWKTESLYLSMLSHPRFEPVIGVALGIVDYPTMEAKKLTVLLDYLHEKQYDYTELRLSADIQERIKPDIVFYQEGYSGTNGSITFSSLHDMLFCYISYFFVIGKEKYFFNSPYQNICWKWYVESPALIDYASRIMSNHACNLIYTGSPIVDEFIKDKSSFVDPWKKQESSKKRIIWAPHHTIGIGKEEVHYGCFLDVAETMKCLAEKYSKKIQWVFKPHPSLKQKLYYLWGNERTNDYWSFWESKDNCQIEEGKYIALFKYSDAIIHDCASFTVEYLYMNKPCMYLINGKPHPLNDFGQKCFDHYYKGHNTEEIEKFVLDVIAGKDSMKKDREQFIYDYLLPPYGKTACENIIDSILGE